MKKLMVALGLLLILAGRVWGQFPYMFEKNVFIKSVVIDSTDGLGRWPARGDSTIIVTLPEGLTQLVIYVVPDSLKGTGEVLDNLTVLYRPMMGEGRADSLQDYGGTGIEWAYLPVYRGPTQNSEDFHNLNVSQAGTHLLPLMCGPIDMGGMQWRALQLWVHHTTKFNDTNADDSIKVWLYGDKK
jgi:hypothetical protein